MWPFRNNGGKSGLRKLDAVVTGLIVGSAIAAVYGIKRRRAASEPAPKPGIISRLIGFLNRRP